MSQAQQPTSKQLSYLKSLALKTGTTFVTPHTKVQASQEIQRLRQLSRGRRPTTFAEHENTPAPVYGTAPADDEIAGHGSSARWRSARHTPGPKPGSDVGPLTKVADYSISTGERVIYGQRVAGRVRLLDHPASGNGRRYLIDQDLQQDGYQALLALVADYVALASDLDAVPAASSVLRRVP
jgi:hypothetical protein